MRVRGRQALRKEIEEVYPDLSFWYGLSFFDLIRMPRWVIRIYVNALDRLQAEQEFVMLQASVYPHLKRSAQRRAASHLRKRIQSGRRTRVVPETRYEETLAGVGIAYRQASKSND